MFSFIKILYSIFCFVYSSLQNHEESSRRSSISSAAGMYNINWKINCDFLHMSASCNHVWQPRNIHLSQLVAIHMLLITNWPIHTAVRFEKFLESISSKIYSRYFSHEKILRNWTRIILPWIFSPYVSDRITNFFQCTSYITVRFPISEQPLRTPGE